MGNAAVSGDRQSNRTLGGTGPLRWGASPYSGPANGLSSVPFGAFLSPGVTHERNTQYWKNAPVDVYSPRDPSGMRHDQTPEESAALVAKAQADAARRDAFLADPHNQPNRPPPGPVFPGSSDVGVYDPGTGTFLGGTSRDHQRPIHDPSIINAGPSPIPRPGERLPLDRPGDPLLPRAQNQGILRALGSGRQK